MRQTSGLRILSTITGIAIITSLIFTTPILPVKAQGGVDQEIAPHTERRMVRRKEIRNWIQDSTGWQQQRTTRYR